MSAKTEKVEKKYEETDGIHLSSRFCVHKSLATAPPSYAALQIISGNGNAQPYMINKNEHDE